MRRLNSGGDTIVEVLISVAVVSAVLGGAFVVVNHTLANSRQSQEHGEALKIAESQVELLKLVASTNHEVFSTAQPVHCIKSSDTAEPELIPFTSAMTLPQDSEASYPEECKITQAGYTYRYGFKYEPNGAGTIDDIFQVYVNWPGATGGEDEVSLVYKVLQ